MDAYNVYYKFVFEENHVILKSDFKLLDQASRPS